MAARPLARTLITPTQRRTLASTPIRSTLSAEERAELEDPNMNGGYINPPPEKRSNRDPYGDWWDKQERRNYGEPVHEDNDILGVFSTEDYKHFSPGHGAMLFGCFLAAFAGLCGAVSVIYEDKPSVPKVYEGGLERELGGPKATSARGKGEDTW
ncbi:hypothetical protein K402DRAFT_391826 [Aulographum hederae CBS 113979]|uniref:NADH:ubiquinone oxidoreductase 20.1kD subunit n=1 Tax=Aulographum hederae CBS 113979 TaxID=1176131 RepID=A0A6G1H621_9PEZI|nr:hypothetical protein K402DRAFT_391826 [Aulographum hederae CBS 113979]